MYNYVVKAKNLTYLYCHDAINVNYKKKIEL